MRIPRAAVSALFSLHALATAAAAQEPAVVDEELDVREVGVVATLPERLRGRSAAELAGLLAVIEGGVARAPVTVTTLADPGQAAFGRVLVVVDRLRCDEEVLAASSAALGARAAALAALGPVEIAELGDRLESDGPESSADAVAARLAAVDGARCADATAPERGARVELAAEALDCPAAACLLVWIGPGWAAGREEGPARPVSAGEIDPLARRLAGQGWLFLAAPIASAETPERPSIPDVESRPGSDRHSFGVNVLDRSERRREPTTAEGYSRFLDVESAPLRRLVAATAGEYANDPEELDAALARLADRSVLYYRTDRERPGEPPTLEIREAGAKGGRYRAPEWAPTGGS